MPEIPQRASSRAALRVERMTTSCGECRRRKQKACSTPQHSPPSSHFLLSSESDHGPTLGIVVRPSAASCHSDLLLTSNCSVTRGNLAGTARGGFPSPYASTDQPSASIASVFPWRLFVSIADRVKTGADFHNARRTSIPESLSRGGWLRPSASPEYLRYSARRIAAVMGKANRQ